MEQVKKQNPTLQALFVGLKLLLICAIVAGVVSFVYALTEEQYERNLQETKNQAIGQIFSREGLTCQALPGDSAETVYRVTEGDTLIGYCVEIQSPGFGGDIEMMVGYQTDFSILGVSIISLSETPGLGAKVSEADFLSDFEGKNGTLVLGEDIDAVSGATISSHAVTDGVNRATELLRATVQ